MEIQKILLPAAVILIFAAIIFLGVRDISNNDTSNGTIITASGWENPSNPVQSPPMIVEDIPSEAIKLSISSKGISPQVFNVSAGAEVLLSVVSEDEWTHIFRFKDESLSDVAIGVGTEQARMIKFFAPDEPGQYEFFCDVPGHEARGEKGFMIVN